MEYTDNTGMRNMTLSHIAEACGGTLYVDGKPYTCDASREDDSMEVEWKAKEASCVVIDSRKIEAGGVFIAAKGERADGHSFISQVADKGALGVVCERTPENCSIPYILVEDSFKALRDIGEYYRKQLDVKVVGITGSVGKTSTKEVIASVLAQKYRVLKTQGNFNNEIGVPLMVLSIRKEHQVAVLEMGISDFGEMHRLSKIARPHICVITNIGQCHLENLGSRQGILKAKSEIFDFMVPQGKVFLNGDDDLLSQMEDCGGSRPVFFGLEPENDIYASDVTSRGLMGSCGILHMRRGGYFEQTLEDRGSESFPIEITIPGLHMMNNALAAAGIGLELGLTPEEIAKGINATEAVAGRSHVIPLSDYILIDDCYNANPVSMQAALSLLGTALGRKVAILGDMFELGENERELHGQVGMYAVEAGIDVLLCVGKLSQYMYERALEFRKLDSKMSAMEIYHFETRDKLLEALHDILKKGDSVLVKASHGMEFEKVVDFIKAD